MTEIAHLAFVRRYSCMYTRDVAKKAKIWHDGYLTYHHLNSKLVLQSDDFVCLDERFFRAPGRTSLQNVPKAILLASGTDITFDRHLTVLGDNEHEMEQDVSNIYEKKRKKASDLDEFLDSEDEVEVLPIKRRLAQPESASPRMIPKNPRINQSSSSTMAASSPMNNSAGKSGWFTRLGPAAFKATPKRPAASSASTPGSSTFARQTMASSASIRDVVESPRPNRPILGPKAAIVGPLSNNSPKVSTPFKAPTFVTRPSTGSSPAPATSSRPRSLGTSRPSSEAAKQSLQADWARFAEQHPSPAHVNKPKRPSRLSDVRESSADREARRQAMMVQLQQKPDPTIVQVNQARRDGESGDTSSWLFG